MSAIEDVVRRLKSANEARSGLDMVSLATALIAAFEETERRLKALEAGQTPR